MGNTHTLSLLKKIGFLYDYLFKSNSSEQPSSSTTTTTTKSPTNTPQQQPQQQQANPPSIKKKKKLVLFTPTSSPPKHQAPPHHQHQQHHQQHNNNNVTAVNQVNDDSSPPPSPIKLIRASSSTGGFTRKRSLQNLSFHIVGTTKLPSFVLPPWKENVPSHWMGREDALKRCVLDLSSTEYTFRLPVSEMKLTSSCDRYDEILDDEFLFQFDIHDDGDGDDEDERENEVIDDDDEVKMVNEEELMATPRQKTKTKVTNFMRASLMLQLDPRLGHIRMDVARFVDEDLFWRSYFYFIHVIRSTDDVQVVHQRVRELQERASKFCGESHTQKELGIQMKWAFQSVDQCSSMVDILLLKPAADITPNDIAHMQDSFQECVQRKMRISLLSAAVSEELEKSQKRCSKSQKTLFDKMEHVNLRFQQLMTQYDQFLEYVNQKPKVGFSPKLLEASRDPPSFTSAHQRHQIVSALPIRFHRKHWQLVYSTYENGISMGTLLRRAVDDAGETILLVKTTRGTVFGAYHGTPYELSGRRYYGNGETFLFSFANTDSAGRQLFQVYTWSKKNDFFVRSSDTSGISFGGGDDGKCGLFIDSTLAYGVSHPCETFDSNCLNRDPTRSYYESPKEEDEEFDILAVEVWGFRWEGAESASAKAKKSIGRSIIIPQSMAPEGSLKVSSTPVLSSPQRTHDRHKES